MLSTNPVRYVAKFKPEDHPRSIEVGILTHFAAAWETDSSVPKIGETYDIGAYNGLESEQNGQRAIFARCVSITRI